MTILDDAPEVAETPWVTTAGETNLDAVADDLIAPPPPPRPEVAVRHLVATTLTASSAALVIGGIFDSWACRFLGVLGALTGTGIVWLIQRSRRQLAAQALALPAMAVLTSLTLLGADGGPGALTTLVSQAAKSGRLLQPPVPFDAGWRPIVFLLVLLAAYAAGWVATALDRRLLGALVPVPLGLLAAFTQPASTQVLAAGFLFIPVLAAMGVLFVDGSPGEKVDVAFEIRRTLKAAGLIVPAVGLLLLFNTADFLFPKPTYDPNNKPQKPRPIPLSAATDRILFRVDAPKGFTGPWRTGVLDVYDESSFKLPAQSATDLVAIPGSGVVDPANAAKATVHVRFTTEALGDSPIIPGIPSQAKVLLPAAGSDIRVDDRTGVLRVPSGRAPSGLVYTVSLPPYPTAADLNKAVAASGPTVAADLVVPSTMPPAVDRILRSAPPSGFARLDYVRHQLLDNITAKGAGAPAPMDAKRIEDMLSGSKRGTPFEIVAAETLLARWAGFPSRIGYGFNQFHIEAGAQVIRPDNAAQWLEVDYQGLGWLPFLSKPPKADASLDTTAKRDKDVVAGDQIAVQLFLPVGLPHPVPLFELVRARILQALPAIALLLLLRAAAPEICRALRRRRREKWARQRGPRARIAVAYAELRDLATDLNVGDPFATPIEYLARTQPDTDHSELAWLVSRTLFGDLATVASDEDADIAEELSLGLRSRLRAGQPPQVRTLALLTQASIRKPYTEEVPSMTLPSPFLWLAARRDRVRSVLLARARRRRLQREIRGGSRMRRLLPGMSR